MGRGGGSLKSFLQQLGDGDLGGVFSNDNEYKAVWDVLSGAFPGQESKWHSRDEDEALWETMWELLKAKEPSVVNRVRTGKVARIYGCMMGYYHISDDEGLFIIKRMAVKSYKIEEEDWP